MASSSLIIVVKVFSGLKTEKETVVKKTWWALLLCICATVLSGGKTQADVAWNVASGTSVGTDGREIAWGSIGGTNLGTPKHLDSNASWSLDQNENLTFQVSFFAGGDLESPTANVWKPTGGELQFNTASIGQFEIDGISYEIVNLEQDMRLTFNGFYSGSPYGYGSFNGQVGAPAGFILNPRPVVYINNWTGDGPPPEWFDAYNASITITGTVPQTAYSLASVSVPEPATFSLLTLGAAAAFYEMRRRRHGFIPERNRVA